MASVKALKLALQDVDVLADYLSGRSPVVTGRRTWTSMYSLRLTGVVWCAIPPGWDWATPALSGLQPPYTAARSRYPESPGGRDNTRRLHRLARATDADTEGKSPRGCSRRRYGP